MICGSGRQIAVTCFGPIYKKNPRKSTKNSDFLPLSSGLLSVLRLGLNGLLLSSNLLSSSSRSGGGGGSLGTLFNTSASESCGENAGFHT
jgi:hypothetical protein